MPHKTCRRAGDVAPLRVVAAGYGFGGAMATVFVPWCQLQVRFVRRFLVGPHQRTGSRLSLLLKGIHTGKMSVTSVHVVCRNL